jgi:hypothetical protein
MKISLTIISFLFCLSAFSQTKYFVSTSGNNTNNGLSNVNPFLTIQFAINSAQSGDSIIVSQGTYQENINFSGKNVKVCSNFVYSGDTTVISATIIDGNNIILPVVNFSDFESQNAHINGFKIRNGKGKNMVGYWGLATHGGGIFIKNASPVVKNCIITNNNCQNGGGIYAENSQATFENVIIQNNNINQPNIPNGGSGLFLLNCNSNIIRCTIKDNKDNPTSGVSNYGGGGVLVFGGSTNIQSSKIIANYAKGYGGGISLYAGSSAFIENTIISNNIGGTAGNYTGGGIHTDNCNIVLKNSVIWGNDEFGISIGGYPNITIFNSILYNNVPAQIIGGFNLNITYSDIQGGSTGVGNINVNPNFVNPSANNFNLLDYSQCIGSGSNIGINQFDINMQIRPTPSGSNCDIGAYENSLGVSANSPPTAINDISSAVEDMAISLNILLNDSDVENQLDSSTVDLDLSLIGIQSNIQTNTGNWSVATNGLLTFVPLLNFNGIATINYTVSDLIGLTSNTASITINVSSVNDSPIANADSLTVDEDYSGTINLLTNDLDVDNTIATNTIDLNPVIPGIQNSFIGTNGTFSVSSTGILTFNPSANFNGTTSTTYTVKDVSGAISNTATIFLSVNPVNDAPVAVNNTAISDEDTPISINILLNDSDVENELDSSTVDLDLGLVGIQSSIQTNTGNWSVATNGLLTFVPLLNFNGIASIQYQVKDLHGLTSNTATVNITVNPVNDAPDTIEISNTSINENIVGVIGQFSTQDVDVNQVFTYTLVSGLGSTDNNSFTIVNNNLQNVQSFNYESANQLSIRVKSTDQDGLSTEQIFAINVLNINDIQVSETIEDTYCNGIAANGSINISVSEINGTASYNWNGPNSFNSTTQDIQDLESGTYTLTLMDLLDTSVINFTVNQIPIYEDLSICYVTGDTMPGNHNRIYFNNPNMYNVQFYQILRESVVQNVYDFIGQVTPLDTSFLDLVSNNQSQSFSYKVRAIDSCGNFSNESTKHSTMLLQSNLSASNSVNLNWTAYNGSGYTSYYLYRSVNAGAFELMVTLPASQLSFNDVTANTAINEYAYFVSIVLPSCDFTKSNNIVRSNVKTLADGGLGIAENERLNSVEISPNPSTGIFNLSISEMNELRNRKFEIINTMGQRLMEIELASTQSHVAIDLSNQANGLYLIRDTEGTWVKQVILNK